MSSLKTSVIVHPPEDVYIKIRQDYKTICCGNSCAAALLAVFEGWANSVGKERWIYRSQEELSKDMLYEYSGKSIGKAIDQLIEWGYVERRNNPKKGYDRKYQYRLLVHAIHFAIRNFFPMETEEVLFAKGKSSAAIQYTQIESKEIKDSITPAEAEGDAQPEPQPETPQAGDSEEVTPVQEKPDDTAQGQSQPERVVSEIIRTPFQKNGKPKTERQLIYEIVCLGSFGKYYENVGAAGGHLRRIVKELIDSDEALTHLEVEGAYRIYADEQKAKRQTLTDENRLKSPEKILSRVQTYRDQQAQMDTRTDDEIRASFTPLQKTYAQHFPDEPLRVIENMKPAIIRLQLQDLNIQEVV